MGLRLRSHGSATPTAVGEDTQENALYTAIAVAGGCVQHPISFRRHGVHGPLFDTAVSARCHATAVAGPVLT